MTRDQSTLALITAIAVAAPLFADLLSPRVRIPLVVFEIVLGVLVGPQLLGWAAHGEVVDTLSDLGLSALFFMAGYEIDVRRIAGAPLRRAGTGWLLGLAVALGAGLLLAPRASTGLIIGAAMATTALGTILPVLRDAGESESAFGTAVTAVGAVGEFCPIVLVALFLSGRSPAVAAVVLLVFAAATALVVRRALRHRGSAGFRRRLSLTLRTSGQYAVRFMLFVLGLMLSLAAALDVDGLLGAFAAGAIGRLLLSAVEPELRDSVESKLEAVSFGFLVPLFFINTGMDFDLDALTRHASTLLLVPLFLVLFLVVRGLPIAALAGKGSSLRNRAALGLFGSTQLPLVVAITTIGVENNGLEAGTAAAMVGAAMLSVLLFPLAALSLRGERASHPPAPAELTAVR